MTTSVGCIAGAVFVSIVAITAPARARQPDRPNIVFIMSDDHAYQAVSAYGSNRNETPNIDRIAREGLRFDRCCVENSICAPSRACLLTGKYSHKHGVPDNYTPFDTSQTTFPELLQRAGYQTAFVGKWHLDSEPQGFDHWDKLPGQGKYYRPDFVSPAGQRAEPGYVTDIITEKALEWLRDARRPNEPFLLMVHHKAPHRPWDPGLDHIDDFSDTSFPEPPTLFDDYSSRASAARLAEMRISQLRPATDLKMWESNDPHRKWLYEHLQPEELAAWSEKYDPRLTEFRAADPEGNDLVRWYYQLYMTDYLRCIAGVDESVGKVLDYLDEVGLADNTLVVYTSDQGFYLGEHGWFDKRFMYEQSLRTPLVMRWPGTIEAGTVEERIVSNVDLAETFLDVAGVAVPADMQGRSLMPLMRGEWPDDWRKSFYYHYYEGPQRDHRVERHEGVTTDRYKLIWYYDIDEWELFDLQEDPHELNNVYGHEEYADVQGELYEELVRLRRELVVPPSFVSARLRQTGNN